VPDGVEFIMATVDVQGGKSRRFVVQVTGYGPQGERWLVDATTSASLTGKESTNAPLIRPVPEDWDLLLSDVFEKSWALSSDPSKRMRLMAMAVDSGGEDGVTDNAYKFWRKCRRDGLGKRFTSSKETVSGDQN
jgi:phage terminase large subunit GpA-like protein